MRCQLNQRCCSLLGLWLFLYYCCCFTNAHFSLPYNTALAQRRLRQSVFSRGNSKRRIVCLLASSTGAINDVSSQSLTTPTTEPDIPHFSTMPWGFGKICVSAAMVTMSFLSNYLSGFVVGGVFGGVTGLPGLLLKRTTTIGQLGARALMWGKGWGGFSGFQSGWDSFVYVIRNGQQSTLLSSAGIGLYLARDKGPTKMLFYGVVYGVIAVGLQKGFSYLQEKADEQPMIEGAVVDGQDLKVGDSAPVPAKVEDLLDA